MSSLQHMQMLTRYKAWADRRVFAALAALPSDALLAPRAMVFGSVVRALNHVYCMDQVWQAHLQGVAHHFTTRNPPFTSTFSALRTAQEKIDAWYVAYAQALQPDLADEIIDFTFIGGGAGAMSRADILFHVVNHGSYHRGQVAAALYQPSAPFPVTDLPVFLREEI
ncbi:MAG: DinB family protein [Rhodanobacter sp.]